jgi:putative flippase GtrA
MAALHRRMARFVVTGTTCAGLFFFLTFALVRLGLAPFFSSLVAFIAAFVTGYALQQGWTFGARHSHQRSLPRYLLLQVVCSLFSGVVAHLSVHQFGLSALGMSVLTTLTTSALSVAGSLFWVFPNRMAEVEPAKSLF